MICKIHNTPKKIYKGFDLSPDQWTYYCEACEKFGTSDGVPSKLADDADTVPIQWPSSWDFDESATADFRSVAKYYAGHGVKSFMVDVTSDGIVASLIGDGVVLRMGLLSTPIRHVQPGAQQGSTATSPSLPTQHSTSTRIVTLPLQVSAAPPANRTHSLGGPSSNTRLQPESAHPRMSSMPRRSGKAQWLRECLGYWTLDRIVGPRSNARPDGSTATSSRLSVQKIECACAPGCCPVRRASEEKT